MGWRTFQAVVDYSEATFADLAILHLLATAVNQDTDRAYPAEGTLARWAHLRGKPESQVRRLQKIFLNLVASGDLIVQNRNGHRSFYYIPLYPGEPGYAPTDCQGEAVTIGKRQFYNGIDIATGEPHFCNGRHTPLSIGVREQLYLRDADTRKHGAKTARTSATGGGGQHKTHNPPPPVAETPATGGAQPYRDHSLTIENDHSGSSTLADEVRRFTTWMRKHHPGVPVEREASYRAEWRAAEFAAEGAAERIANG